MGKQNTEILWGFCPFSPTLKNSNMLKTFWIRRNKNVYLSDKQL